MNRKSIITIFGGSSALAKNIAEHILMATDHEIFYSYCSSRQNVEIWFQSLPITSKNRVQIRQVDASDSNQMDRFFHESVQGHELNSVISCIGYHSPSLIPLTSDAMWQKHIDVNLTGNFYIARAAIEIFNVQKNGLLIFMSSIAKNGAKGLCAYSASKAGLDGLTKTIAKEYDARNIRAYNLSLGVLETEQSAHRVTKGILNKIERSENAFVKLDVVSNAVLDLIHDKTRNLNGSSIEISGGQNLDA
jgi:NAD(P)-dependent dehydrogenase (short-subunit alcohol dehydrogenase family)